MAARTLPNLGLKAFFSFGEDGWNNEVDQNFLKLSVVTQGGAIDIVATKPLSPTEGSIYVMSAAAISNPNTIAVFFSGAWMHFAPNAGWTIYIRSTDSYIVWAGTEWRSLALKNLRAFGSLDSSAGLLEQTGDATFTKRAIGANADTDVLTRASGDARYAATGHTHPVTGVTAFNTRSGAVTLSQADVQTALGFVPATSNPILTSLSALGNSTIGLVEQTGPNAFGKRAIGTNSPSDIPTLSMTDMRYQSVHSTLTALTNLPAGEFGVIEQYGSRTFRIRSVGVLNNTDLLTRGGADSLYISNSSFTLGQISDVPSSYTGKAEYSLCITPEEDGIQYKAPGQVLVRTTGISTVLALGDAGVHLRASASLSVTIPTNADVSFAIGTTVTIYQASAGKVTISPDSGVTLDFLANKKAEIVGQNGVVTLLKYDEDSWTLSGDLSDI